MDSNQAVPVADAEISSYTDFLQKNAKSGGYYLNPDKDFVEGLVSGLLVNKKRYGYESCPCRLATCLAGRQAGSREKDLDIICPCDYRDEDISEFGACYCGLYVSKEIFEGKKELKKVPDRRAKVKSGEKAENKLSIGPLSYPVYRCKVCGYLCARENPPDICPICKATKDRFEVFINKSK